MSESTHPEGQAGLRLDYDSLQLGSIVPESYIERLHGVRRLDDPDGWYNNILAPLKVEIERHFKKRGKLVTAKFERNGIKICTDEEAVHYNKHRRQKGIRDVFRALRRQQGDFHKGLVGVDVSKLSPATRATLERETCITAQIITSINSIRQKEALRPDWRKSVVRRT